MIKYSVYIYKFDDYGKSNHMYINLSGVTFQSKLGTMAVGIVF